MTNLQLLSLLSKPHRDGFLTGGNMLGNDDDDIMYSYDDASYDNNDDDFVPGHIF